MPQVDLDTLVSVCGGGASDRKIACETLADTDQPPEESDLPDVPPESFWLSKDAEFDWFDRNAFYERKESTKGNSNSTNLNPNSSSQRYSANLMSKASIIGLPKTQKTNYIDTKRRNCKPVNIRFFPKQSDSVGKNSVTLTEPSSPKVSCMGRVRSKRGRRRSSEKPNGAVKSKAGNDRRNSGCCGGGLTSIFRRGRGENAVFGRDEPPVNSPPRKSVTTTVREIPVGSEPVAEPPGLGGMTRFASGRRSASSWGADDLDQKSDFDVARSEPSDRYHRRVELESGGSTGRS